MTHHRPKLTRHRPKLARHRPKPTHHRPRLTLAMGSTALLAWSDRAWMILIRTWNRVGLVESLPPDESCIDESSTGTRTRKQERLDWRSAPE